MIFKFAFVLSASAVLLTGCGSASTEPKYDEVELIQYQACVDYTLSTFGKASSTYSELVTDKTIDACKKYLPVKK
jgi:N12 class adenine-specific DNA methylase